ncbi:hypothetical protein K1T71_004849 [Dendrolimus kikuchii]|uniref:Uncharacterized protein n=1 Tax=Dendrolimus kikuchii TaxID=765133 RepID=A0ACC1D6X3_9NEOP|nr:hypothetical protein K1T71_004849 [Dendrolimus kikuchii]
MTEIIFKIIIITLLFYKSATTTAVKDRFYPRYHLAPPFGWMNDPNGFCYYQNEYHLFYQYNPFSSESAGVAHWGHAVSTNLVTWKHLPIAMKPDQSYDKTGVFSGSGIVVNDILYLFYTGNVNFEDQIPDRKQVQAMAYTTDGINVIKYDGNPIINGTKFQPDFRDPKVWKHHNDFYMILGHSLNNNTGEVLLYESKNLIDWKHKSVLLRSNGSLGYMWECPDIFKLKDYYVLLFSPQGIQPQGDKYRNIYQTGYISGYLDHKSGYFKPLSEFYQIDEGSDFYATQTMLDKKGRRIMIAWMDTWGEEYPERADGSAGQMTLPRELFITPEGQIIQKPIDELDEILGEIIYSGKAQKGLNITLPDKSGKIVIRAPKVANFSLHVQDASNSSNEVLIHYDYEKQRVTVNRQSYDGLRRAHWSPKGELKWVVFIDASSIELFCGEGEVTFSFRVFLYGDIIVTLENDAYHYHVQAINRSIPLPNST